MINVEETKLEPNQGLMAIMDASGDTKVIWDRGNDDEIEAARSTFDRLKARGYVAYSVKKDGEKNEILTRFDPNAEKLIMAPQMVGG